MWLILFPTPLSLDISFPAASIFFYSIISVDIFLFNKLVHKQSLELNRGRGYLIYLKVYITACWRMLECIWRMWQKWTDLETVKQLLAKENEFSSGRAIASVWKRATLGANRVIDHPFSSEAPYAMIPGET